MIRLIDIRLNAAHPELPLAEAVTYTGAPSTMLIRGVPGNCGKWCITSVYVAATFPDGSTSTRLAVQSANGVWVATLPATATSGRTASGVRIMADGEDENGEIVTGYILGVADFAVASLGVTPAPEPGATSWQMLYFDTVPGVLRKGDVTKIDGVLKIYNGTAWEPFADLSGCVPASRTINGKALTDNVSLSGADIPVDETQGAQKIDAALAGKLGNSGAQTIENGSLTVKGNISLGGSGIRKFMFNSTCGMYYDVRGGYAKGIAISNGQGTGVFIPLNDGEENSVALRTDVIASVQQIAPAWVSGTAYTANVLVTYYDVVYRCKANTVSPHTATPDADATHWEAKPVSELFLRAAHLITETLSESHQFAEVPGAVVFNPNGVSYLSRLSEPQLMTLLQNGGVVDAFGNAMCFPTRSATSGQLYDFALTAGPNHTGNLASLDANGNPTDSGVKPSDFQSALTPQQLANIAAVSDALAFDATHSYAAGDPVVYNGTLYTFTAAHTGAWTGSDVSAVDIIARLAGKLDKSGGAMDITYYHGPLTKDNQIVFAISAQGAYIAFKSGGHDIAIGSDRITIDGQRLALTALSPTVGNLAALDSNGNPTDAGWTAGDLARYALVTKTISNGAVTLDDRAINAVAISSSLASLTVNFPTATSGKARDFGLRLTVASGVTTAPELALPHGVVCENADGEAPEIGADGAATILYFTETASGVFLVKGETLTAITQA